MSVFLTGQGRAFLLGALESIGLGDRALSAKPGSLAGWVYERSTCCSQCSVPGLAHRLRCPAAWPLRVSHGSLLCMFCADTAAKAPGPSDPSRQVVATPHRPARRESFFGAQTISSSPMSEPRLRVTIPAGLSPSPTATEISASLAWACHAAHLAAFKSTIPPRARAVAFHHCISRPVR